MRMCWAPSKVCSLTEGTKIPRTDQARTGAKDAARRVRVKDRLCILFLADCLVQEMRPTMRERESLAAEHYCHKSVTTPMQNKDFNLTGLRV